MVQQGVNLGLVDIANSGESADNADQEQPSQDCTFDRVLISGPALFLTLMTITVVALIFGVEPLESLRDSGGLLLVGLFGGRAWVDEVESLADGSEAEEEGRGVGAMVIQYLQWRREWWPPSQSVLHCK